MAAAQAEREGALIINNAIITAVLGEAIEEGTTAAVVFSTVESVSTAVSSIATVAIIIQFLGLLVDMWDPSGYSQELNAEDYGYYK